MRMVILIMLDSRYNSLSEAEKELLFVYILARANTNSRLDTLIIVTTIMYVPGIILLFASNIELFMLGIVLIGMSIASILYCIQLKEQDDKYFLQAFGITNYMHDIFHISKTDISEMRKKWVLPKIKKK